MPVIKRETSIAANATDSNLLSGSTYEYPPWNARLRLGVNGSATGLEITVLTGSDVIQEEAPARVGTAYPDQLTEMDVQDVVGAGQRLVVRARNTTGGALTARAIAELIPI